MQMKNKNKNKNKNAQKYSVKTSCCALNIVRVNDVTDAGMTRPQKI